MESTTDTLVPVKVDQPAPTTAINEQQQPTITEAAPTNTTTSPKKTLPNINSNVNRKDVPEVKVPSPSKKKGNAPIAHAPHTAQAQPQYPYGHPGAPHFYPYPPVSFMFIIFMGVGIIYCGLLLYCGILDGVLICFLGY
jgi:hypothetical protein